VASGAWAAEAALILPMTGRWFDEQRFGPIFWFVALTPLAGVGLWLWLSKPKTASKGLTQRSGWPGP
jgi:hypothetical protein